VNVFGFDMGGFVLITVLLSVLVPLLITVFVVGTIVWAIRRSMGGGGDPAVAELRARLARGEIDDAEFQARLDSLNKDR
jgi:uncharacterized membrane protein